MGKTRHHRLHRALALAVVSAAALTSCAINDTTMVPALTRTATEADATPSHWDAELTNMGVDHGTSRLIGTDTAGYEFYATARRGGGYCLIVSLGPHNTNPDNENDTWRGDCSKTLPVVITFTGVTATLNAHGHASGQPGSEIVGKQVEVRR